jgi:hypothetical protein
MKSEWSRLCDGEDIDLDGTGVTVRFHDGRRHQVTVTETADEYQLHAVVARPATVARLGRELPVDVWLRNRAVSLVGFRHDSRGRLVCEAHVPKAELTAAEFRFYLRTIAIESDRFEYSLTGQDVE